MAGGWVAKLSCDASGPRSPPMSEASSCCTTPTSACPGVSDPITSSPSAFSFTRAMNSRTAGRATSASSSANRTSRSISAVLVSVRRASPRMVLTTLASRWVRLSSMGTVSKKRIGSDGYAAGNASFYPMHSACRRMEARHRAILPRRVRRINQSCFLRTGIFARDPRLGTTAVVFVPLQDS